MTIYLNRLKTGSPEGVHWVTAGGSDGWNGDGRLRSRLWSVQRRRCRGGASSEMGYGGGRDRWHIHRRPKEWASSIMGSCGGQWHVRQSWMLAMDADGIMPGCATRTHRNHQTRKTNTACVSVACVMSVAWRLCYACCKMCVARCSCLVGVVDACWRRAGVRCLALVSW